jgi:hypothetical protein
MTNHVPFGTPGWLAEFHQKQAEAAAQQAAAFAEEQTALLAAGVVAVGCEFSGSGDDGEINDIRVLMAEDVPAPVAASVDLSESVAELVDRGCDPADVSGAPDPRDLMYFALDRFDGDWVNNEGGYGHALLDLRTGVLIIDGYQYVQHTEAAWTECKLLAPGVATPRNLEQVLKQTLGDT